MEILLLNPVNKKSNGGIIRFPLGLAYIADALSKDGHHITVLDLATIEWDIGYLEKHIDRYRDVDAIGITGLITEFGSIKEISALFKKHFSEKPFILGGALATSMPDIIMNNMDIDIIVSGEGEITSRELFRAMEKGDDISGVRGIYFKKGASISYTGQREYVSNLDALGYPSRSGFNVEAYFCNSPFLMFGNKRPLNVITSRGCPFNCLYCDKSLWGNTYRARSAENIVEEFEYLQHTYHADSIIIHDDTFNLKNDRINELCDLLIDKRIKINWLANCRANLIQAETLKKMRRAGCRIIAYGIESGNQEILDSMHKNIKVAEMKEAISKTWKAGIVPFAYLMLGWFSETREQILDTIKFCKSSRVKGDFSFFTPLPNTQASIRIKAAKNHYLNDSMILANWSRWHDRPMINISSISNEELMNLKKYAESRIFWDNLLLSIFMYMRALGLFCFLIELARRIASFRRQGFNIRVEKV